MIYSCNFKFPNMPSLSLLPLIFFFPLFSISSAKNSITLALSLTTTVTQPATTNIWQRLNRLATSSSARAQLLKNTNPVNVPVYPRAYGYSISLGFGTPTQYLSFFMDTATSVSWFSCTDSFACNRCDHTNIPTFKPDLSSSSKNFSCDTPQCKLIFPDIRCMCKVNSTNHCNQSCPRYRIQYGSGRTNGRLLSETLTFPESQFSNFIVGCSDFSDNIPDGGIVGFGRGQQSLPSQMALKSFSYCLISHKFDDNSTVSSDLVLNFNPRGGVGKDASLQYIPFNNISSNPAFQQYYYVLLQNISVGGVDVKLPEKNLLPNASGHGGTVIDTSTTFTIMHKPLLDLVAQEFEKQLGNNYSRATLVEEKHGLNLCFNNVSIKNPKKIPQLSFHFEGGEVMVLPLENYILSVNISYFCMSMMSFPGTVENMQGPAIILGNYQQQNFYMGYDLENNRLGFQQKECKLG